MEPLEFVTAEMMARELRPSTPVGPNTLPTTMPMAAPMTNLEISSTPPRLTTPPMSRTRSVVPRQNSWIPMAVLAPALVKTAVVKEPMLVTSGRKVLIIAPSSIGTTIIPAQIFFRNRMIMVFLPPQFVCWGGRGPLPWPFASIPRMSGRSCGPSHQRDLS